MNTGLLEIAAEQCGAFISDLRDRRYLGALARTFAAVPADAYPLAEWEEAVSYLLRREVSFENVPQAKRYFSDYAARRPVD